MQQRREANARPWIIVLLLLAFVAAGTVRFWNETGEDLSSSYVGCRIVSTGQTGVLYSYDRENFADVGDLTGTWERLGKRGGFAGYLHPYVQTPLWAYSLEPLCDHMQFPVFKRIFLVAVLLSLAGVVWLVGRYWTPAVFAPWSIALVLLGLWFSQPFGYAMFLMQTHALFFFLTIAGLVWVERGGDGWRVAAGAGLLVAGAAAVKLTPAVLVVYWLLTGRWRAAVSTVVWSAVLMGLTVLAVGPALTAAYFESLHRVSRVLLVAQNNQSFAAWVMARFYPPDEVFDINSLPLPTAVRLGSTALLLGCTALGGWLDRRGRAAAGDRRTEGRVLPAGAMVALVALTIFAPIAWTHYSIILVAPVMVLVEAAFRLRSVPLAVLLVPLLALNYPPLASQVLTMDIGDYAVVRGQFFSGVLALVGLLWAGWQLRQRGTGAAGWRAR